MAIVKQVLTREQFFEDVFAYHGPVHRIYSALGKYPMIWGCDRELFIFNCMLSAGVVVLTADLIASILSITWGFVVFYLLALMGQADPLMRYVYLRQLKYKPYYIGSYQIRTLPTKNYRHRFTWL